MNACQKLHFYNWSIYLKINSFQYTDGRECLSWAQEKKRNRLLGNPGPVEFIKVCQRKERWKLLWRNRGTIRRKDWCILPKHFRYNHKCHLTQNAIWAYKCIILTYWFWTVFCSSETLAASPKWPHIFTGAFLERNLLENFAICLLFLRFLFVQPQIVIIVKLEKDKNKTISKSLLSHEICHWNYLESTAN